MKDKYTRYAVGIPLFSFGIAIWMYDFGPEGWMFYINISLISYIATYWGLRLLDVPTITIVHNIYK